MTRFGVERLLSFLNDERRVSVVERPEKDHTLCCAWVQHTMPPKATRANDEQDDAATKLQAKERGRQTRRQVKSPTGRAKGPDLKSQETAGANDADEQDDAATKLQAKERGRQTRRQVNSPTGRAKSPDVKSSEASRPNTTLSQTSFGPLPPGMGRGKSPDGKSQVGSRPDTSMTQSSGRGKSPDGKSLDGSRPNTTMSQTSWTSDGSSSRPGTRASTLSKRSLPPGMGRADTPGGSSSRFLKRAVEPPLGDGPWDIVLHGPPPLARPSSPAKILEVETDAVEEAEAEASTEETIAALLAAKRELLRFDVTLFDVESHAAGFDRIHGVSSDNLTAFISTGAFKSLNMGGGAPNDLNDMERCIHKIVHLCSVPDMAAQVIARLNTLTSIPAADVNALPLTKRRFRFLLQNLNLCVYACLVCKRGKAIFSEEALAAAAADDAAHDATPVAAPTADVDDGNSNGADGGASGSGNSRVSGGGNGASAAAPAVNVSDSPRPRSDSPTSHNAGSSRFNTFTWHLGLTDEMKEILSLNYIVTKQLLSPVVLLREPIDLAKCDGFYGTPQSWCRKVMNWLSRYTLTPYDIQLGSSGTGYLFPKMVKELRKRKSVLGDLDLDESPGAPPVAKQLARALKANHVKVLDLFREWDSSGDGVISRKEFLRAMKELGLNAPDKAIFALFDEYDTSGDKEIDYQELAAILRKG